MANLRLVQYIEKELGKNFPREQIKQVLVKYNYQEPDIDEAFKYIDEKDQGKHPEVTTQAVLEQAIPKKRHFGYIIGGIALVIIIAFMAMYFAKDNAEGRPILMFNDTELKKVEPLPFEIPKSDYTYFEGMVDTCIREYMAEEDEETISSCVSIIKESDCDDLCKSRLYLFNALKRKQKSICQSIPDEDYRKGCHAIFDADPDKCTLFSSTDDVKYCKAFVLLSEAECEGLEDQIHCVSEVREIQAIRAGDASLCMNISSVGVKNECLAFIRDDPKECYHYTYCSDEALQNIAALQNNKEMCERIWNTDVKNTCYQLVGQAATANYD